MSTTNKTALICGVSGQDGAYLAKFLLQKGYRVVGSSRDVESCKLGNLERLGVSGNVELVSMQPEDFRSVFLKMKAYLPDEVYFLAGQSSVGFSFEVPSETIQSFVTGLLNILEATRLIDRDIKVYNAGSSECFGDVGNVPVDENTLFHPRSPYAVAKLSSYWLIDTYRNAYGIHASTGMLFNHESPLRSNRFVTQKICSAANEIAKGNQSVLELGRLDIVRDWGWAPEYVEAMWLMLQQKKPQDYVIATGQSFSLEEFVAKAFSCVGLDWQEYVVTKSEFCRPSELVVSTANPKKAEMDLGWKAKYAMPEVVEMMMCENLS